MYHQSIRIPFPFRTCLERVHPPYQTGTANNGEALPYPAEPDRSVNPYYNPDTRRYGYVFCISSFFQLCNFHYISSEHHGVNNKTEPVTQMITVRLTTSTENIITTIRTPDYLMTQVATSTPTIASTIGKETMQSL